MADEDDDINALQDPSDVELRKLLEKKITDMRAADGDDEADGLLAPPDEPSNVASTVAAEDGYDMVDKARRAPAKADAPAQDTVTGDIDDTIAAKPAEEDEVKVEAPPVAQDLAALFEGIPEEKQTAIRERIAAGDGILDQFRGREEELALHGPDITPAKAVERLLYLNTFAQEKPAEYLAWVSQQMGSDKPAEVLSQAAALLGFKLVPDAEDDDEFEDEEKKRLRAENRQLKGTSFGPDAPQNVANMEAGRRIRAYMSEKDADGNLKHPLAVKYQAEVAGKIAEFVQSSNGQMPTTADLSRFYHEVAPAVAPKAAQTPAAQPANPVPEKTQKAANPARAAASKMLDGSGQGASPRPALQGDALLKSQIAQAIKQSTGG